MRKSLNVPLEDPLRDASLFICTKKIVDDLFRYFQRYFYILSIFSLFIPHHLVCLLPPSSSSTTCRRTSTDPGKTPCPTQENVCSPWNSAVSACPGEFQLPRSHNPPPYHTRKRLNSKLSSISKKVRTRYRSPPQSVSL